MHTKICLNWINGLPVSNFFHKPQSLRDCRDYKGQHNGKYMEKVRSRWSVFIIHLDLRKLFRQDSDVLFRAISVICDCLIHGLFSLIQAIDYIPTYQILSYFLSFPYMDIWKVKLREHISTLFNTHRNY